MALYTVYSPSLKLYRSKKGALWVGNVTSKVDEARTTANFEIAQEWVLSMIENVLYGTCHYCEDATDWTVRQVVQATKAVKDQPDYHKAALKKYRKAQQAQAKDAEERIAQRNARERALGKLSAEEKKLLGIR